MADLTKKHPCESLSDPDFSEGLSRRAALLADANPQNPGAKGLLRQKSNLNNLRERLEKQLRALSRLDPEATVDEGKFSAANKEKALQDMRAVLSEIRHACIFTSFHTAKDTFTQISMIMAIKWYFFLFFFVLFHIILA